jgi:hypothetical protein
VQGGGGTERRLVFAIGIVVLAVLGVVAFSVHNSGDYSLAGAMNGDNAAPGIEALVHGSLSGYAARQPLMGLTTIVLRLPFAALVAAVGGGQLAVYEVGAFVCLLPLAWAAAWIISAPGLSARQRLVRGLAVLVVIQSPALRAAVKLGHPEEIVAAVLATAAVLVATKGHARTAAVLLGLAIGAKESAAIAVLPVMIALPGRRLDVGAITTALVALLVGAVIAADPAAFARAEHAVASIYLGPLAPLWPVGTPIRTLHGGYVEAARTLPLGLTRTDASFLQTLVAGALGGVWYMHLRRKGLTCEPIRLLAVLGALRCICDTGDIEYYWVAMLLPVAAWEATEDRFPLATLSASIMVWAVFDGLNHVPSTLIYLAALAAETTLIAYLARGGRRITPNLERSVRSFGFPEHA